MTLTLHLSAELEEKLKEHARSTGKNPEDIALDALQQNLSDEVISTPKPSIEKKLSEFRAWANSHRSRNPNFDDSRESIYPDR
ncbi:MAG: hypothetical protein SH868_14455 [Bythopirellula sp.]|nr:hypothetical protein [Bythopirellula sp.]